MRKFIFQLLLIVVSATILAACSGAAQTESVQPASGSTTSSQAPAQNPAEQPIEDRLALGTLKLEGTDLAVTSEQAQNLLPLWKAVRSLNSSETASAEEIAALYEQIQETMTQEQVQAIQELSVNPDDLQALMQQYGVEMPQMPEIDEGALAARATQRAENGDSQQMPSGEFPGGGMMPGGGAAFPGAGEGGTGRFQGGGVRPEGNAFPGGANGEGIQPQGTPSAGMGGRGFRGGMSSLLVNPLIELLEERAGS